MGTRSRVAVMHGDVCKSVYCHYDGYLEYTGKLLLENKGGFHGDYIGGQTITTELARDCWLEG